jgi:uncharacterized damage-inducible protein DinB
MEMTDGMDREGLLTLYEYNAYATGKLLDTVEKLGEDQLSQEMSPSHGTIRRLLQHMLTTETFFLAVCQGHLLDFEPTRYSTVEEIRAYWDGLEHRMRRYIEKVEEDELKRIREFRMHDRPYALSAWELLVQAFVHAAHHRGELSILLSQVGQPMPNIDIIQYFVEQHHQSQT